MNTEYTTPTFEEFLHGVPIITTTLDERKQKLVITLKNDKDSGLQFVHFFVNRFNQKKPIVHNLEDIRQHYQMGIAQL